MKVYELIALLSDCDIDAEVEAWDEGFGDYLPVTGAVFDSDKVQLQTDEET